MSDDKLSLEDRRLNYYELNLNYEPKNTFQMHNGVRVVGLLNFGGDAIVFEGDVEESAKVFFDFLAKYFADRLKKERDKEREACARMFDGKVWSYDYREIAAKIRARGQE